MTEPTAIWWKYIQVVMWAFTRNLSLVNRLNDSQKPVTERYAFEEIKLPGGEPVRSEDGEPELASRLISEDQQREPSLLDQFAMAHRPGGEYDAYAEAQWAIHRALQTGELECSARPAGGGQREPLSPAEWADLKFSEATKDEEQFAVSKSDAPIWQDLRFKSQSVIEFWPPEKVGGTPTVGSIDAARQDMKPKFRKLGDPKPETVARWREAHDLTGESFKLLGGPDKSNISHALKHAARFHSDDGWTYENLRRARTRYITYQQGQKGKKTGD